MKTPKEISNLVTELIIRTAALENNHSYCACVPKEALIESLEATGDCAAEFSNIVLSVTDPDEFAKSFGEQRTTVALVRAAQVIRKIAQDKSANPDLIQAAMDRSNTLTALAKRISNLLDTFPDKTEN